MQRWRLIGGGGGVDVELAVGAEVVGIQAGSSRPSSKDKSANELSKL